MSDNLDVSKIVKPLRYELRRGCDNGAIVGGGVDKLIEYRAEQIAWLRNLEPLNNRSYSQLSTAEREEWINNVLNKLIPSADAKLQQKVEQPTREQIDTPLQFAKGILLTNPKLRANMLKALEQMNLETVRHLLWHVPRDYRDYSDLCPIHDLTPKTRATVMVRIMQISKTKKGRLPATHAVVADQTGRLQVTWFGQDYLAKTLDRDAPLFLSGPVTTYKGSIRMNNPEYEFIDENEDIDLNRMLPLYALSEGVTQRMMRYSIRKALAKYAETATDWLPPSVIQTGKLLGLPAALNGIHFPANKEERAMARRRLVFDELFLYQLEIQQAKREWAKTTGGISFDPRALAKAFKWVNDNYSFELTRSQKRALSEIIKDMSHPAPMLRLLQGEVGSGKTAVALTAMLGCAIAGHKAAMLVPTEILSEQHFLSAVGMLGATVVDSKLHLAELKCDLVPGGNLRIMLFTGSANRSAHADKRQLVNSGAIDVVIGTHALIQEEISIRDLGLAVIDEQHRFGVEQRAALAHGDVRPNLLLLSATPIPRTLQLTAYGDMEISGMRELPQGKRKVETLLVTTGIERYEAYKKLRREVELNHQALIVCPFIEPSPELDVRNVADEYRRLLQTELRDLKVDVLHGRMGIKARQGVMSQFRANRIQVLITTSIVEVGLDVANTTLIMIENAERFGVAQLHQLRGRVGRGGDKAYCILCSDLPSEDSAQRLRQVARIDDGFKLAEKDLELRGPGDYLGDKQSGWGRMRIARVSDMKILREAREQAQKLVQRDAGLLEREPISSQLKRFGRGRVEIS